MLLIDLRRGEPALEVGRFEPVEAEENVLAYVLRARTSESHFLVALNLGPQPQRLRPPGALGTGTIALSTHLDRKGELMSGELRLRPSAGVVIRLRDE